MEFSFINAEISCGFASQQTQPGYKLSNGVILLHTERDINGSYFGAVGLDGIYLRTGKRYRPVFNTTSQLQAFQEV